MFLGTFQLGDELPIVLDLGTTQPDAAPVAYVIDLSDGSAVENFKLPIVEPLRFSARFAANKLLDSNYADGWYGIIVEYAISAASKAEAHTFEVVGTADSDGHIIGMHYLERPESDNVQYVTKSGKLINARGPY